MPLRAIEFPQELFIKRLPQHEEKVYQEFGWAFFPDKPCRSMNPGVVLNHPREWTYASVDRVNDHAPDRLWRQFVRRGSRSCHHHIRLRQWVMRPISV